MFKIDWDTEKRCKGHWGGAGVVQRGGDHFDCEGLGRKFLPQPALAWFIQSFSRNYYRQGAGQAMGRTSRARDSLAHLGTKESDLRQIWIKLDCAHTLPGVLFCFVFWERVGERVLFKSRFWFSRSGWARGPAFLTSPQVMPLPVRYFE